ncbi:37S ribosomal protein, mitochondrial [Phlyctochytrium planicorne]|nr:37S ribosomal protein, mitochondrial [Phlyctochytrium planicorne]
MGVGSLRMCLHAKIPKLVAIRGAAPLQSKCLLSTSVSTAEWRPRGQQSSRKSLLPQEIRPLTGDIVPTTSREFSPIITSDLPYPTQIRTAINLKTLMAANLHLGHGPEKWNRFMLPFVYGERGGIRIINLEHTIVQLRRAMNVTREVAFRGGSIVFLGTKPSLHKITVAAAKRANGYYVTKWIGGTITNKDRVLRRSSGYDPDKIAQALATVTSSREANTEGELEKTLSLQTTKQPKVYTPDLLIVLDMPNNLAAIREANQMNIPVISVCDTDCNPRLVSYPIAANDDSVVGIELIAGVLSLAAREGWTAASNVFSPR